MKDNLDHLLKKSEMKRGILFVSIMDFTDSGIQVVKLTPQFFYKNGWDVHYVVARDNSKFGSYHYQEVVNPDGITVHRVFMPMIALVEKWRRNLIKAVYSKLRGYIAVLQLTWSGYHVVKKNSIDVIYGGGPHGVIAANLIKLLFFHRSILLVSRFYGTFLADLIISRNFFKILLNWDECLAFMLSRDLVIITNDGTRGDAVIKAICPRKIGRMKFWVNGVDSVDKECKGVKNLEAITICRLVSWKRVDRAIICVSKIVHELGHKNFKYHIVGDGPEFSALKELSRKLLIDKNVIFHGSLKHESAMELLIASELYISTYDLSNVGNPLLEAIRANKIIFTLNNGDTSSWIKHYVNGFIYKVDEMLFNRMSQDIAVLLSDPVLQRYIKTNIQKTEVEKLWTWSERLQAEYDVINELVNQSV